ncbi:hypothetical protein Gohar_010523 [Gossypium harknessii]|uniref:AMP-dependent synthetase/ligase domain-containing protein n=1 Tax=Gossypium harknessii TaxID=34285 RepID=A0A7J9GRA4_9ROSI|nr:hypothetical protein [Gossypium harknessii]
MSGAVINPVNIRLNASTVAFLLGHSQSAVVIVDQEFFTLAEDSLKIMKEKSQGNFKPPLLVVVADESCDPKTLRYALGQGAIEYEKFLESGDPEFSWKPPQDEWQSIALNYTSGTTASPKGVVLHHRGAYLMSLSNPLIWGMNEGAIYLWTLPMFHCNGWCFTWALAALCGTNICLRQVISRQNNFVTFTLVYETDWLICSRIIYRSSSRHNYVEIWKVYIRYHPTVLQGLPMFCSHSCHNLRLRVITSLVLRCPMLMCITMLKPGSCVFNSERSFIPYKFSLDANVFALKSPLAMVTATGVYSAISKYGVTHFCAAPVVLNSMVNAPSEDTILPLPHVVHVMTAGAAPPSAVLFAMSQKGFRVTHTYGLSETYGPSTVCAWKPEWDSLPPETQARLNARQGVRYIGLEGLDVISSQTGQPVAADGKTIGEIVMRGNLVMKGYLKNPKANEETFANGWFHSGDLGVKHPDGYIEIKDRSKDIIISGGENISSVEVENSLYLHPAVLEASVVARADERWGESPCAFVTLKPGVADKSKEQELGEEIMQFCRSKMPAYWVPKSVVFGPLPKTATGKIQKHILRGKAKELGPVKLSKL